METFPKSPFNQKCKKQQHYRNLKTLLDNPTSYQKCICWKLKLIYNYVCKEFSILISSFCFQ